ncbi:MAG: N-acetyltransferase [Bacteroidetes bacterium]|nr:MAG: N-acetyltransferase [Bacteroidota bacterium]
MRIEGERVVIRTLEEADAPHISRLANNIKVWRNVSDRMPYPYLEEHAVTYIANSLAAQPVCNHAIEIEGAFAGVIGIMPREDIFRVSAEIGYWLGEPFWGKGFATEAVRLFVPWCFEQFPEVVRLYGGAYEYNSASMGVLQKAGFRPEAVLRKAVIKEGKLLDEHIFALHRDGIL